LLVLDNCEQIVEGAGALASAVLAGTTRLDILATSREALGIVGEHRVALEPLGLDGDAGGAVAPAAALFLERAAAAGRRLDAESLPVVHDLCRRLDGLPLAIELAAARVTTRTLAEIVADVTERLADLSIRRGRAERHRSIHALVEWSYDLLDEPDRRLFELLSVFAGGADAEAIAAVAGGRVDTVGARLQSLAEQSLVSTRARDGATRYALLEPVRAYAQQRLLDKDDDSAARAAHAGYFVNLATRANEGLRGAHDGAWMTRLDGELANLRAAHTWLLERADVDGSLRLAGRLFEYAWMGNVSEVHVWAERAATRFADTANPLLAAAWATAGCGAWLRGDLERARAYVAAGLAVATDDADLRRPVFQIAGNVAIHGGNFEGAGAHYRTTTELSRLTGDDLALTCALASAAMALAYAGQVEEAYRLSDAALAVAGNATMRSMAYYCAGEIRLDSSAAEAGALLDRSIAEAARAGGRFYVGVAGLSAASVQARTGDAVTALARYPDLIEHWQRAGAWNHQWVTLRNLVETLALAGHDEPAAVLYGAMCASPSAAPLAGADAVRLADMLERLRLTDGEALLSQRQKQGAAMDDSAAVAYAIGVLRDILTPASALGP
jgi:predicted ATPase